ncbi:class E sortase [Streptomyces sp. NPDC003300]|uniref:class E sortase n=1 Tax=unclassified Streptomyces TaxID=2593676 RepID=UPI0033A58F00
MTVRQIRHGRRGATSRRGSGPPRRRRVVAYGRGYGRRYGQAYGPGYGRGPRPRRSLTGRLLWAAAELAMTAGVLVLLLVVHQLWWTNVQAHAAARREVAALERSWGTPSPSPAAPSPGTVAPGDDPAVTPSGPAPSAAAPPPSSKGGTRDPGFAVIHIPRIGITAPIAEGISKSAILNHGYVGHYPGTAGPGATGNFALAGHRNTHGEPFRYINRLRVGDTVEVETAAYRYTYVIREVLPQTYASDGTVIAPIPYSSVHSSARMRGVAHYITLTTCTPEFTSRYRLVLWGTLQSTASR